MCVQTCIQANTQTNSDSACGRFQTWPTCKTWLESCVCVRVCVCVCVWKRTSKTLLLLPVCCEMLLNSKTDPRMRNGNTHVSTSARRQDAISAMISAAIRAEQPSITDPRLSPVAPACMYVCMYGCMYVCMYVCM
jgi:hypothetical protein